EDRGARADGHARLALAQAPPLVVALARGELAVQHGHDAAQASHRRAHEEGRERDLGDEEQRAAALLQRALDGAEVDLGLSAAGDAVEKEGSEARAQRGPDARPYRP